MTKTTTKEHQSLSATVQFTTDGDALAAVDNMDRAVVFGKIIRVTKAE